MILYIFYASEKYKMVTCIRFIPAFISMFLLHFPLLSSCILQRVDTPYSKGYVRAAALEIQWTCRQLGEKLETRTSR